MTIKHTSFGWATAALLLVSVLAFSAHRATAAPGGFSQHHHKMGHGFGPHRIFKMIHHLDLSRDQREKIGSLMDKNRPLMRTFMLDMMDAKKALQGILNDPNYDPAAVETLAKSQAANAESMFLATASTFAEIGNILTPEQRKQVSQRMDKGRGWSGKGRRGEHGGFEGPGHGSDGRDDRPEL